MSRLTNLIAQAKAKDRQLGADLDREFGISALGTRRAWLPQALAAVGSVFASFSVSNRQTLPGSPS